jgi:hypothetical protein
MRDEQNSTSFGDYLHALAFRVLHEDRVLQPRRASLFESGQAELEEYTEPAQIEVAELLRPSAGAPATTVSENKSLAQPAATAVSSPGRVVEAEPPKLQPVAHADSRLAPQDIQPAVTGRDGTGSIPGASVPPAPLHTSIEVIRTAIARERLRVVPEPVPAPVAPNRAAEATVAKRSITPPVPQDAKRVQRQSPDIVEVPVQAASMPAEIRQIIHTKENAVAAPALLPPRRSETRQAQAVLMARTAPETRLLAPLFTHPPRATQEETTVEINIGRLEIRASQTSPAPPPRTPQRQPDVSLKEYLTRNTGGRS